MTIKNTFLAALACIALPCSAQVNQTWVADTASAAASVRFWGKEVGRDGVTRSIYFEYNGNRVAFTPIAVWLDTGTRLEAFPDSSRQIFGIVEAVMNGIQEQNKEAEQLKRKVDFQDKMLYRATEHLRMIKKHPLDTNFQQQRLIPKQPGLWRTKCAFPNALAAYCNGFPFGDCEMEYDGSWCRFYQEGKEVFSCNPNFAFHNFFLKKA